MSKNLYSSKLIVSLTNGRAEMSENVFRDGGILSLLEHRLDVATPQRWKPHVDAYRYVAEVCAVPADRMMLAAVHPWDIDGARRAGLQTAYIDRRNTPYPKSFLAADLVAPDFEGLAEALQAKAK